MSFDLQNQQFQKTKKKPSSSIRLNLKVPTLKGPWRISTQEDGTRKKFQDQDQFLLFVL